IQVNGELLSDSSLVHELLTSGAKVFLKKTVCRGETFTETREKHDVSLCSLSSAPVTLDPNTAHPDLHLSEDLTAVEIRDQISSLPDNPERFNECPCVLGSEGFNSGIHCWDVQVGDCDDIWYLGVTTESVTRKGSSFMGSVWGLCYIGEYGIHYPGQRDHFLTVKEKLQRVRVQLDWDRGEVTFTDLLTNTHLHTITHTFTQRVLPFFCNRSGDPLRILPVKTSVTVEQHS
uniref:B30.2/SPRY domain-containing protein n=1 Tax=Pygocentrus nattereri TaxID=42514 RepID=A0AAR2J6A6_PYGNA